MKNNETKHINNVKRRVLLWVRNKVLERSGRLAYVICIIMLFRWFFILEIYYFLYALFLCATKSHI